jgi:hypothetical protein
MSRDYDDYEPRSRRRWRDDDYEDFERPPQRSGWVIAVAVLSLIAGSIVTLASLFISFIAFVIMMSGRQRERDESTIVFAIASPFILLGIGYLVGGFGLIARKKWGRVLTLIVGTFNFLLAAVGILGMVWAIVDPPRRRGELAPILFFSCAGVVLNLGYGLFVYLVLLRQKIAEEFQ